MCGSTGCNGLHTTTAHNRFLGGIGGYNGLPTVMSGLDESLSDVTPRKKYPFELEKALHNVMFIQHHIQRQDEFNAVRIFCNLMDKRVWGEVCGNFTNFEHPGRSGLGFRSDGSRQTFPLDLHYSFDRWHVHHSLRGTGPSRQHQTDRHGVFLRGPATIPSSR